MIFDNVNITDELKRQRITNFDLLKEVNDLLGNASDKDEKVLQSLKERNNDAYHNLKIDNADLDNIYTIKEIETICINYRLRFLHSKYYKKEFPYDAIAKVNDFEKRYNTKIKSFKIIAPNEAFELMDVNQDPLLFAQLTDNTYYLLHQWGNDLAWYRKFIYYPIRSIYTYFYSIVVLAFLFSFSIPFSWLQVQPNNEIYMRMWFMMHCTIGFFFFILFLGAISQSSLSSMSWKSKYFNE